MACGLGADAEEEVGVLERQLNEVTCDLDGGILAEDIGVAGGRYRSLCGLLASMSIRRWSAIEVESETDTDTATVAIGGGGEVGGGNLALWPNPRQLAFVVVDQGPVGFIDSQGVG